MRPDGSLNEMDAARLPDSCYNCQRQSMCGINSARWDFQRNYNVNESGVYFKIKLEQMLAQHCGHHLRGEES